jgi:hypothetical protein
MTKNVPLRIQVARSAAELSGLARRLEDNGDRAEIVQAVRAAIRKLDYANELMLATREVKP